MILFAVLAYAVCGLLLGVPFVAFGVGRVDEAARGTGVGFRLMILPGSVALWPLVAARWLVAKKGGRP